MKRVLLAVSMILLGMPMVVHAQTRFEGQYVVANLAADTVLLADGLTEVRLTSTVIIVPEDTTDLFYGAKGRCAERNIYDESGVQITAGGSCAYTTPDRDGYIMWSELDEAGTERCPLGCGRFGLYSGYGKFQDMSSEGTWQFVKRFADGIGGLGVFSGTYTKP